MEPGRNRDVVVIGGSAGSLEPIKTITAGLPAELPAAVLVTMHLGADAPSLLSTIIGRVAGMPAVVPRDGDPVKHGYIYVAKPDCHLEVDQRGIHHGDGPRVNGVRPAIDVMFKTAVAAFGPHVVGVVLSGGLDDGSAGLASIKRAGGATIVQDPDEATVASMPLNAIQRAAPDHVALSDQIARLILDAKKLMSSAGPRTAPRPVTPAERRHSIPAQDRYERRRSVAAGNAEVLRRLLVERD